MPPTRRRSSTPGSRRSSWPRRSRATAWASRAKGRTSPTSRRRWVRRRCAVPRSLQHPGLRRPHRRAAVLQAGRGQRHDRATCASAGRHWAGICRLVAPRPRARGAGAVDLQRGARREWRAPGLDHHGLRAAADGADPGQEDQGAHRSHRRRRGPHLRHGRDVPAGRDLRSGGPALHPRGRRPAGLLPGGEARVRFCRRESPRPARCRRGSPPAPPTPTTASTWCPSSSSTRCSASSGSAI